MISSLPMDQEKERRRPLVFVAAAALLLFVSPVSFVACGGGSTTSTPQTPAGAAAESRGARGGDESPGSSSTVEAPAPEGCGSADKVQVHDLNSSGSTQALLPCAKGGAGDFSGAIRIETIPEGVHITIRATDDQVDLGMLGSDVKTRDAVIVYPRGKGEKAVEVPLTKTKDGYIGDKTVMWDDLDKLNDEGTKFDIAVYDHDGTSDAASEEMHVSIAVSTGKSCERARDENPQTVDLRGGSSKAGSPQAADLTDAELGAPMKTSAWFVSCGLPDSANADICVAVKEGKPLGVSVAVVPENKRVAACIDRSARKLHFPASEKLDVVHQRF